jgi:2-polyprenyl-3-methyl-5-hydroxy-6-metoxy-1,4-benzoquinol methylase
MATASDHYANHLAPLYEWMVGDMEAALQRSAAELDAVGLPVRATGMAVDLGAGIGLHALPLARRGYSVVAIDSNEQLLATLQRRAGSLPIATVADDLLGFTRHLTRTVDVIVCMGDTLTHLPSVAEVAALFASVAESLTRGGVFVTTFRDYFTVPLVAERRFISVRSDAQRILTCFLEYADQTVLVHDLLHQLEDGHWTQRVSSYQKIRLSPAWVAAQLQHHGFDVRINAGMAGMVCVVATQG